LEKPAPENLEDLKAIQQQVQRALAKAVSCTVGVRVGAAQGSGVIISEDGYILTAGHVSGQPGRNVTVTLPNGRTVKGKTLGSNHEIDSGLIRITEEGKWPSAEMGDSAALRKGQWCLALGHPGGFKPGRTPVVRLGRILDSKSTLIRTDCTLVGGDSGGPLFDLDGKVIGIHSRIGSPITFNIHVPVDTYRETWARLTKSDIWGGSWGSGNEPYLGFQLEAEGKECRVLRVAPDSPAARAGLQVDDVVLRFGDQKIDTVDTLASQIKKKKPGDKISLEIRRGKDVLTLNLVVGKRGA